MCFGDAGGDDAHAGFRDQLDVDTRCRVGVFEVEDELCEVFDRIDIVMGWGGDQSDARGGVAHLSDPFIYFVAGELAPFTWFGALCHFDLEFIRIAEVVAGDAKTPGGHLLDGGALPVVIGLAGEADIVFASFAAVAFGADAVHGDGEGGVRFMGNRTKGHGTGSKAPQDVFYGFHLFYRDGGAAAEGEQPAEGEGLLALLVDELGVLFIGRIVVFAGSILQQVDGVGVKKVCFAPLFPLIHPTGFQLGRVHPLLRVGQSVADKGFLGDAVEPDAFDAGDGPGEALVHDFAGDAQDFEDLGTLVGLQGGNPDFGHDLEDALVGGVVVDADEVGQGEVFFKAVRALQLGDGGVGQIRVDRAGAKPDQDGKVMGLPDIARLDDQGGLAAQSFADEVVVYGTQGQERGKRGVVVVGVAVGQNQDVGPVAGEVFGCGADVFDSGLEASFLAVGPEDNIYGAGFKAGVVGVFDAREVFVAEDRAVEVDEARPFGVESDVGGRSAQHGENRHHAALPDGVDGRVGDLCEELFEVVGQVLALLGEDGQRGVGPHGADGFLPFLERRLQDDFEVFARDAIEELVAEQGFLIHLDGCGDVEGQIFEGDAVFVEPIAVGQSLADDRLDLFIAHDAFLVQVGNEHAAWLQPAFAHDAALVNRQRTRLGGHDEGVVVEEAVARGAQAVAVEGSAHQDPVGEDHGGRPVPGLHEGGVVFVEGLLVVGHVRVMLPGLRDHHHEGVGQGVAAQHEELEHVVEVAGIGEVFPADRHDLGELVFGKDFGLQLLFLRFPPVQVAGDRVDFPIVRDVAEGLGQFPLGNGIGGKAGVDQGDGRAEPLVLQVWIIRAQLVGGQLAFIDDRLVGERGDVKLLAGLGIGAVDIVGGEFAQHVERPLQIELGDIRFRLYENMLDPGLGRDGRIAQGLVVGRHFAIAQQFKAALVHIIVEQHAHLAAQVAVGRKEDHPNPILAERWQFKAHFPALVAKKSIGDLQEYARPIARIGLAATGAPVLHIGEHGQRILDQLVRLVAVQVGDEACTTGVFFELGHIQPLVGKLLLQFHKMAV